AFFDEHRFTYEPGFYAPQIQAFLDTQPGPLKRLSLAVGDQRYSFAEALVGQTVYYGVNPKVLLALLEMQSHLLSSPHLSEEHTAGAVASLGEKGNRRGLAPQLLGAVKQMFSPGGDSPQAAPLPSADNPSAPAPPGLSLSEYAMARTIAPTSNPAALPA